MVHKEELKESALTLFAHRGYAQTTTQDIAAAVGLQKQSLYTHYKSKQELYTEVLDDVNAQIYSELKEYLKTLRSAEAEAVLLGVFRCLIRVFSHRERLLLWKRDQIEFACNPETDIFCQYTFHFDALLKEDLFRILGEKHDALKNPETFRGLFISYMLTIQGYLDWMTARPHNEQVFSHIWDTFWNGMKTQLNPKI